MRAIHDLLAAVRGAAADRLRRTHPTAVVGAAGLVVGALFVAAFSALDDDGRDLSPTAGAGGVPEVAVAGEAPATTGLVAGAADPVAADPVAADPVADDRPAGPPVTAATAGAGGGAPPDGEPVGTGPTAATDPPPPATGPAPADGTTTTAPASTEPPASTTTTAPPAPDLLAPLRPLLELLGLG